MEELELFTVSIKNDGTSGEGTVKVVFNEELLAVVTQAELFIGLEEEMEALLPIVAKITNLIKSKI